MVTQRLNYFSNVVNVTFIFAVLVVLTSIVVPLIFRDQIVSVGHALILRYGQERIDIILYLITAVSSTPLALPVWIYAVLGAMLGYEPVLPLRAFAVYRATSLATRNARKSWPVMASKTESILPMEVRDVISP